MVFDRKSRSGVVELKRRLRGVPFAARGYRALRAAVQAARDDGSRMHSPGLERVRAGEVVLDLAEFGGEFELDARSHLFWRIVQTGSFEPEVVRYVRENFKGGDAIDVGANAGFYTVLLARLARSDARVLAVEPTPGSVSRLRENVARNGVTSRVVVHPGAAGEEVGTFEMEVVQGREEYSSAYLDSRFDRMPRESIVVPMETLDGLVAHHRLEPTFVKIDVEGAELSVLRGASRTLREFAPRVVFETCEETLAESRTSIADLKSFLENHGYRVRWITENEAVAER